MKNLDLILSLLTYEGAPTNDPTDADKVKNRTQETEITSVNRYQFIIPDATTDLPVTLPASPCLYSIILCDRDISIKLNGWSTALALKPRANGKKTWVYYTRGAITALTVTNASGADVNMDIVFANK